MRIKESKFKNETGLMIYLREEERSQPDIISQIEEYKKVYKTISIFISGKEDVKKVIKQMIANKV